MSYTALYRKLRPSKFYDVVGQGHIIKTLLNQITSDRISHAYLFCGTRGTGKTSTAKILAKAVNCLNLMEGEPCGRCQNCESIAKGSSLSVIEIDAASNNGVDNIREIREEVKYAPPDGKYKVYIIDEVHMLSTGAFNALLKTLEEPPSHVIFILATTDPQKIPPTILSRCQRFDFKRITATDMVSAIQTYIANENITIDGDALFYIAQTSDGAMRDALSVIDQCASYFYDETITLDKVLDILGAVEKDVFFKMTDAFMHKDSRTCFALIEDMIAKGRDITQFVNEMTGHLRNLLIVKTMDAYSADLSKESFELLKKQSETMLLETIMNYIKIFSELLNQLKYASSERILLEVTLIKICHFGHDASYEGLLDRIASLEDIIKKGPLSAPPRQEPPAVIPKEDNVIFAKKEYAKDVAEAIRHFDSIKQNLSSPTKELLHKTYADILDDTAIYIVCPNSPTKEIVDKKMDEIVQKFYEKTQKNYIIRVMEEAEFQARHEKKFGRIANENKEDDLDFENLLKNLPDVLIDDMME